MRQELETVVTMLLDETSEVSLEELCAICGTPPERLREMVIEGLLQPRPGRAGEWRFSGVQVRRARRAIRLSRDLDVNLPGVGLALDLLDELEDLRVRVRALERLLQLDE